MLCTFRYVQPNFALLSYDSSPKIKNNLPPSYSIQASKNTNQTKYEPIEYPQSN